MCSVGFKRLRQCHGTSKDPVLIACQTTNSHESLQVFANVFQRELEHTHRQRLRIHNRH